MHTGLPSTLAPMVIILAHPSWITDHDRSLKLSETGVVTSFFLGSSETRRGDIYVRMYVLYFLVVCKSSGHGDALSFSENTSYI